MKSIDKIKEISMNKLKELYGNHIEHSILDKYKTEMEIIQNNHYEDTYLLLYLITKKAQADNKKILLRSCGYSSFIAYLLGFSCINPIEYNILFESFIDIELNFVFDINKDYMKSMYNYILEILDNASMEYLSNYNYEIRYNYNDMWSIKYNKCNITFSNLSVTSIMLMTLEKTTGIKYQNIDIKDKKLLEWVVENSLNKKDIEEPFEFGSKFTKQMINTIKPKTFEDLVITSAFNRGTGIWQNNNEELIKTHNINQLACNRDDVFLYLVGKGVNRKIADELIKSLCEGNTALKDKTVWNKLVIDMEKHNIPQWYITSLGKIQYMLSKSNTYRRTIMSLWLAWYEVNYKTEFKQIIEELKIITYKEVEERLKNVKLEDMTSQDVFDRYIGYGDNEELNNIEIQKLLLKHNYIEYLISSVETIITDKAVIEKITSSNLFKDSKYHLIRGRIENIEIMEDKELPKGFEWLIVNLQTQAKEEYKLKYMYYPQKQESYKNQIERNIGNDLIAVAECKDKEYRLCCFLK